MLEMGNSRKNKILKTAINFQVINCKTIIDTYKNKYETNQKNFFKPPEV